MVENLKNKIIIDTNFLLAPLEFNIDIISEFDRVIGSYELFMFEKSILELQNLYEKSSGNFKRNIKLALKLIIHLQKTKGLKILSSKTDMYLDDLLVNFLKTNKDYIVATCDKELQKRVLSQGSSVLLVRQKKYLVVKKF